MISKRAEEYIREYRELSESYTGLEFFVSESDCEIAVEIAEEDMVEKASHLFEQIISEVFQGDMLKKMAKEFKQNLWSNRYENNQR